MATIVKIWKAAPGARFTDEQAARYGPCIAALQERDGKVFSTAVVKAARPRKSPLHNCFEWDDATAAKRFRLTQACDLVNHLTVLIHTPDGEVETRAFLNVRIASAPEETPVSAYLGVETVMADPALQAQVLERALREAQAWRRRYGNLKELAPILQAIRKVAGE